MEWLKVTHPETFTDLYNDNGETDAVNLADAFCDILVASPVAVGDPELTADETEQQMNSEVEGEPRATLSADETENNGEGELRATLTADSTATKMPLDQSHNNLRYISKYLVQFVPDAKS